MLQICAKYAFQGFTVFRGLGGHSVPRTLPDGLQNASESLAHSSSLFLDNSHPIFCTLRFRLSAPTAAVLTSAQHLITFLNRHSPASHAAPLSVLPLPPLSSSNPSLPKHLHFSCTYIILNPHFSAPLLLLAGLLLHHVPYVIYTAFIITSVPTPLPHSPLPASSIIPRILPQLTHPSFPPIIV